MRRLPGVWIAATAGLLVAGLPACPARAADLVPYANARFGFAVSVPRDFKRGRPPDNGDGQTFKSADGSVQVTASGHLVDAPGDMKAEFKLQVGLARDDGLQVTYSQATASGFTYSGLRGITVVYVHAVASCGGSASASLEVTYPVAAKPRIDPLIGPMAQSLRATQGCL